MFIHFLSLLACFLTLGSWLARNYADGFAISKISSSLAYHSEWEVPFDGKKEEIKKILSQPFSYLGKGAQCFVFLSQDGQHVIKFFRHTHMRAPFWVHALPQSSFKKRKIGKKQEKLHRDFASYCLAWRELKEETGLEFLHLNKTKDLGLNLTITDKLGIAHTLELDQMEFALQKRAHLVYPTLEKLIAEGNIEKAGAAIANLVDLLKKRREKRLYDKDPDLATNFGFIDLKAIQIDIGRFKGQDKEDQHELIRVTDKFSKWLQTRSPVLAQRLKEEIK